MAKVERAVKLVEVTDTATNAAQHDIAFQEPYTATVTLRGSADLFFHRWNAEAVDEKGLAPKNSAAKKTDNLESYVWRNEAGELCLPGEYVRGSILGAAKFRQDPRSPRKSALDLFKAGIVSLTPLASLGTTRWDYEDRRRAVVQRNGINRTRPVIRAGWECEHQLLVLTPEYINRKLLYEVLALAGKLVGVADYRPTYGRFHITKFSISSA